MIHKKTWLLKGQEGVRDLFSLYIYIENFKNLLVRNHWTSVNKIWRKCFFGGRPSTKIVQVIIICKKTHEHQGAGPVFPIYLRGMFEMNCLLSSSSISTWGTIKTNTYLYRVIQYLHNGV